MVPCKHSSEPGVFPVRIGGGVGAGTGTSVGVGARSPVGAAGVEVGGGVGVGSPGIVVSPAVFSLHTHVIWG